MHELATAMADFGHYVTVIYSGQKSDIKNLSYEIEWSLYQEHFGIHFDFFHQYFLLKRIIKRGKPDIVFIHGENGLMFSYLAKKLGVALEAVFHATSFPSGKQRFPSLGWRDLGESINHKMLGYVLTRSRRIHAFSSFSELLIKNGLNVCPPPINLVALGVDSEWASLPSAKSFSPSDSALIIASWGRLECIKGYEFLIRAIAILRQDGIPARLKLIGEGTQRRRLEALVRKVGLEKEVQFFGHRTASEIRNVCHSTHLGVFPTLKESFGLAIAESVVGGVPTFASRVGAVPEVLRYGLFGTMFQSGNSEAIAAAVCAYYRHPEIYVFKANEARLLAKDSYKWSECARRILNPTV